MSKTDAGGVSLLPCPFCGGEEVSLYSGHGLGKWVSCRSCGLEAPSETGQTKEQAIEYWNRRSTPVRCDGEAVAWRIRFHTEGFWRQYTEAKPTWTDATDTAWIVEPLYAAPPARSDAVTPDALWEISERVSNVIRSYMTKQTDGRLMGLLNDVAHDVYEEIMTHPLPSAKGKTP